MEKQVVIISNSDWSSFWYQKQEFAKRFSIDGAKVIYINKTLQRWPSIKHLFQRLLPRKNKNYLENEIPVNIKVITPFWLPPLKYINWISRFFVRFTIWKLRLQEGYTLITYVPTYNTLNFIDSTKPGKVIYVNVHNYNANPLVLPDLLIAEKDLVRKCDYLFGDSIFNKERIARLAGRIDIKLSPPGVNFDLFSIAYRGDEAVTRSSICFFGGIGSHMDIELYNMLAESINVTFIGIVDRKVEKNLSKKIKIRRPVLPEDLPDALKKYDILAIFYKKNSYIDGVIPAKFYECLATGKPLFVSGLNELAGYNEVIYNITEGYFEVLDKINNLEKLEREIIVSKRLELASYADWGMRFIDFCTNINFNKQ